MRIGSKIHQKDFLKLLVLPKKKTHKIGIKKIQLIKKLVLLKRNQALSTRLEQKDSLRIYQKLAKFPPFQVQLLKDVNFYLNRNSVSRRAA